MEEVLKAVELLEMSSELVPELVWSMVEKVIADTFVPKFVSGEERPCEKSDFDNYTAIAESNAKALKSYLLKLSLFYNNVTSPTKQKVKKSCAISLLLLCGEHDCENKWTTIETVQIFKEVLDLLCELWGCDTYCELLVGGKSKNGSDTESLFKSALLALRPKLLKNTWRYYPASVNCYKWLLLQVKSPHLSEHLNIILPTALIIVDDYVLENKICGILCLHHIIENVTRTELCWYGQSNVVYKALEPLLYSKDPEVIQPLIGCFVVLLAKLESGPDKDINSPEWTRCDDILEILLQNMMFEQRMPCRMAYIKSLPSFLEIVGYELVRWSKRLLSVLQDYLEVASYCNEPAAKYALQALQVYLKKCPFRIPHHSQTLLQMLLRCLYDTTIDHKKDLAPRPTAYLEVLELVEDCLTYVVQHAPEQSTLLCKDIKTKARFNDNFSQVIDRVFFNVL